MSHASTVTQAGIYVETGCALTCLEGVAGLRSSFWSSDLDNLSLVQWPLSPCTDWGLLTGL